MNKQTKALKMAKEALIEARKIRFAQWRHGCDCEKEHTCNPLQDRYAKQFNDAIIAIEDFMAEQPVQEPVAWVSPKTAYHFGITDKYVAGVFRYGLFDDATIPLYTHPAPSCRCEECGMKYCECGERK